MSKTPCGRRSRRRGTGRRGWTTKRTAVFSEHTSRRGHRGHVAAAPRCQRTFRRLPEAAKDDAGDLSPRWFCPFCDEREIYETVADRDLREYAAQAYRQCVRDFSAPPDASWPTRLLIGLRPECVGETTARRYDLYIQRGSDPFQLRLQIGHEVFHRVGSRGAVFHWTHEMLACLMSVRLLHASDDSALREYADQMRDQYHHDSQAFSVAQLLAADLRVPPADAAQARAIYGRAFALGEALTDAAGWPAVCRLAHGNGGKQVQPDVAGWLRSLDIEAARRCAPLLSRDGYTNVANAVSVTRA